MSSNGNKNQEGQDRSFIQNGLEHYLYSPKKVVTLGLLFTLIGGFWTLISRTLSGYKLAVSEVNELIVNNRDIIEMQVDIKNIKETNAKQDVRDEQLQALIEARINKK